MESQISFFSSFGLNDVLFMAEAAWRTLLISVISISIGTLLGTIFGWMLYEGRYLAILLVAPILDVFRSVPLIIQLVLFYNFAPIIGFDLDAFESGKLDKLFLVRNEFVNTMTQSPVVEQLLPLEPEDNDEYKNHWDYIYEPDNHDVLNQLMARYLESQVYQAVVENGACEQAARMLAMKNATENAGELIDDLQLVYNKARQAAITQELSEIVSGAAAIG